VDPITVGAAALLLHNLATAKRLKPLNITLGIDEDCGDSISFADTSASSQSQPSRKFDSPTHPRTPT